MDEIITGSQLWDDVKITEHQGWALLLGMCIFLLIVLPLRYWNLRENRRDE